MHTKRIQPGYGLMLLLTVVFTLGALLTLGFNPDAQTTNLLGYKGMSSLAPVSTLLLLGCSFITCKLRVRYFVNKMAE